MKTLTNLEFKKNGQKNNAIVSRETLGESKQITALQEENGIFKYETADGVKEIKVDKPTNTPYTIKANEWVASEAPFKFKATLTLPRKVDANDEVKLDINNELAKFKNYQIGATNLTAETLDLVAMKQPLEDLNISLVIGKTDLLELPKILLPFKFKENSNGKSSCVGYTGDLNISEITIPRSYNKENEIVSVLGAKVTDKELITISFYEFTSISFSDGQSNQKTYYSFEELEKLPIDFVGDCYITEYDGQDTSWLDRAEETIEFPIVINEQTFNDGPSAAMYTMNSGITYINFAGDLSKIIYYKGNDNQVDSIDSLTPYASGFTKYNGSIITLDNITSIKDGAFSACAGLISIVISNNIANIGSDAFGYCTSLNNITYKGTIQQWNAITKGDGWNSYVPATVVHCTNGDAPIGGV